ncbi:hypothetical protein RJ639_040243 [Escallonia herrerae]|uniref:Chalcone synthase n=1 Tax=Escallonia herrerae TaxID=1293975 RepID=A0AA88WGW1_9ASTE|nr:hypothetical protein RJ639_040243 [Escallonia herrerae]
MIQKRYMHLMEELLKQNPNMYAYMAPSLDTREDMVVVEIPKFGKEATTKAINEWGQPKSKITYLIFYTTSDIDMHAADYQLIKLLGLRPSIKRLMIASVLVVCFEITAVTFRGPSNTHLDSLVGQAIFGDGAATVIIGADPDVSVKRPLFQLMSVAQTILPDSDGAIDGHLPRSGAHIYLLKDMPELISMNIEKSLKEALCLLESVTRTRHFGSLTRVVRRFWTRWRQS